AHLTGDEARLVERLPHVRDAALRLPGTSGEQVGDMADVRPGEVELGHGGRRDLRSLADLDLASGGQRQSTLEASAEDVGGGETRLGELLDRAGCLRGGERSVRARLDRCLAELVQAAARVIAGRRDGGHRLVELREARHGARGETDEADTD